MTPKEIYDYIDDLYKKNAFVQLCGIKTHRISCARASVGLKLDATKHTNLNGSIHGGLLMGIMDNATGIAAAAIGKRVVTVSMTVDFIKGAPVGSVVEAEAYITHRDGNALTMSIHMYDKTHNKLMASAINSMLVIADFPGIPEEWSGEYIADLEYLK
ncbi:MAG: PaaI family thioesterase [Phascolarctobacterium sp.]|nr:PaaI family thioesterase [Phascolarctobacterium sp.]